MKAIHKVLGPAALAVTLMGAAFAQAATGTAQDNTRTAREERGEQHKERASKELGLTEDQQSQLKAIHKETRTKAEAIRKDQSLSQDQKREQMKALHQSAKTQRDSVLNAEQKQKVQDWKQKGRGRKHGRGGHDNK